MLRWLLSSLLLISSLSECSSQCAHSEGNKHLECVNVRDFPLGSSSVEVLRAANNTFINIAANALRQRQFASLKVAVLRNNHIHGIAEGAFNGLSSLLLLDLCRNGLEKLAENAFLGARSLKMLMLAENRLRYLHAHALSGLDSLDYLDLSRNNIDSLPENFPETLPAIKYLDVSHNPLSVPGERSLLSSSSLIVLRASLASQKTVSPALFADLNNLQVLDLSGSNLEAWPHDILKPLSKLRTLHTDKDLSIKESVFVPSSVKKYVQSAMNVDSSVVVEQFIEELRRNNEDINFSRYFADYIEEGFGVLSKWQLRMLQKVLLFAMLVYVSFMYILCFSQVVKSIIQKPYQQVSLDEI